MFRHVLIPLDGSSRAEQVLPVAARLARASGGTITLLRVLNISQDVLTYGIGAPFITPGDLEEDLRKVKDYLDQLCLREELSGIAIQTLAIAGTPAAVIIAEAEEQASDLIVISSHGYTGVKRWLLGSVAEQVAHHALAPVLILRDEKSLCAYNQANSSCSIRALVPLDTSARSQDVLAPAAQLVAALSSPGQGELQLATIVRTPEQPMVTAQEKDQQLQKAWQNLDAIKRSIFEGLVADFGPDLHPTITKNVSRQHDIAEGIVQIAEHGGEFANYGIADRCDLIAITTHGAGGIAQWALGSIATRVLHSTRLPMLIVRPADMALRKRGPRQTSSSDHRKDQSLLVDRHKLATTV